MIDPNIKDLKDWAVAEKWLSRHGYGPGNIQEQKELWEAKQAPKAAATQQNTSKAVTSTATKVEKAAK